MAGTNNALREKLERLKVQREQLVADGEALARQIEPMINPLLVELVKMEVAAAATLMDNLVTIQGELLSINSQIYRIEAELGY